MFHRDARKEDAHIIYRWEYTNESERLAATGFRPEDVGVLARQLTPNSLWMLVNHDPPTWEDMTTLNGSLQLGTTSGTAFRGDYGQLAYEHIGSTGESHAYIDQPVTSGSSPYFIGKNITGISHSTLSGLGNDDHPQYLNVGRGDQRYYLKSEVDTISGTLADQINKLKTDMVAYSLVLG